MRRSPRRSAWEIYPSTLDSCSKLVLKAGSIVLREAYLIIRGEARRPSLEL
jgi:hypothetical protein